MMYRNTIIILLLLSVTLSGCDSIFGTKYDETTDEIFEVGEIPPSQESVQGYSPLLPFFGNFNHPTDVFVGYDGLVYVTDAVGVHVLDRADLAPRQTFELDGAVAVTQDRLLNVYVAARYDTVISDLPGERGENTWNLPAIYKIKNLNGAGPVTVQDILVHPFDDVNRQNSLFFRLNEDRTDNDEFVEFTGIGVLSDNRVYVTRRGPRNSDNVAQAERDDKVLEFVPIIENGVETPRMRSTTRLNAATNNNNSLRSGIQISDIATFINPPQRDNFPDNNNFIITQSGQNQNIPFRVLQINETVTADGQLDFVANNQFLVRDTTRADGFLYEENKFDDPAGIAISGDGRGYIFVVDREQHMFYQFKANGEEGIDPISGDEERIKNVNVSFGGLGTGAKQFNSPSGVAYFDQIVYIADTGNNRIARFKLSGDIRN